ncbi:histidine phosphatase family protein, partial [Vibrio parahaemolyticus]|nr:histidine phosphatase family protein [Vibrio parahaemolyticus]
PPRPPHQPYVPLTPADDLHERDVGDFDGMPCDLLTEHGKKLDAFWQSPAHHSLPHSERLSTCSQRVSRAWSQIINDLNDNLLIVTHGGV